MKLGSLPGSRSLAALLVANVLCLALLNAISARCDWLLWIWPLSLGCAVLLFRGIRLRARRFAPSRTVWAIALVWIGLLTVPRLPYLLDRLPDARVVAHADDHGRLGQLISLTQSVRYPVPHPSNEQYLLSHYYAALLPMAWLKFAIPALRLKECILLGNLLYHGLLALSLLEMASRWLPAARSQAVFVFLMTIFGGLDWLTTLPQPFAHHEHWYRRFWGEWREVSSFYTVAYWAVHHLLGLWSMLLAALLARHARWRGRWRKPLLAGLLLGSGLYSSFFPLLALPFVAPGALWRLTVRLTRTGMIVPLAVVLVLPAFLFFGRMEGQSMRFLWPATIPALAYLSGVLVLDLAGLPWLVRANPRVLGSGIYFATTLFVSSTGLNNYGMRGLLLPLTVLFLEAAPRVNLSRKAMALALLATAGTLRETAWLTYQPLEYSHVYWRLCGRQEPDHVRRRLDSMKGADWYNFELRRRDFPWDKMDFPERELARRPRRGWLD